MFGKFPVHIIGAGQIGNGVAGLIPTILNIIIIAQHSNSAKSGFICFQVSAVLNFLGLIAVAGLFWNDYFLSMETSLTHRGKYQQLEEEARAEPGWRDLLNTYLDIFKNSWVYLSCVVSIFTITLAAFPAVTALIEPSDKGKQINRSLSSGCSECSQHSFQLTFQGTEIGIQSILFP